MKYNYRLGSESPLITPPCLNYGTNTSQKLNKMLKLTLLYIPVWSGHVTAQLETE
jgi:hypothetical protein